MSSFTFNKIYFIISDDDNKRKEAFQTIYYRCLKNDLECELMEISSKNDFKETIKHVRKECINKNIYPYIHLECHGNKKGLVLLSKATINWNNLTDYFLSINKACKNNLFISLATCYGGYLSFSLIEKLTKGKEIRTPFFGLIGPKDEIKYFEIEKGFDDYFQQIIELNDLENGITELQNRLEISQNFVFRNCEEVFIEFVESFIELKLNKIHETKDSFNNFIASIPEKYFSKYGYSPTRNEIEILAKTFSNKKFFINELRETYFMIDLYPENKYRFKKLHDIPKWNNYFFQFFTNFYFSFLTTLPISITL